MIGGVTLQTTAAAIVAGGRARRFGGQDKSRLLVEGRPIIVRQVEVLRRVATSIFVAGGDPNRYTDIGLNVYEDRIPGLGAIGGILTALDAAETDRVVVVACDMPFLDEGLIHRLIALSAGRDGAWVRTPRGPEPLMAVYAPSARAAVHDAINAGQLQAGRLGEVLNLAEMTEADVAIFGPPERLLANVNSPDDFARVQLSAS